MKCITYTPVVNLIVYKKLELQLIAIIYDSTKWKKADLHHLRVDTQLLLQWISLAQQSAQERAVGYHLLQRHLVTVQHIAWIALLKSAPAQFQHM